MNLTTILGNMYLPSNPSSLECNNYNLVCSDYHYYYQLHHYSLNF